MCMYAKIYQNRYERKYADSVEQRAVEKIETPI